MRSKRLLVAELAGLAVLIYGAGVAEPQAGASWQHTGWGGGGFFPPAGEARPYGGWSCAFHPTKDGVIYLGGDVGGAYRTDDKGLHWRFIPPAGEARPYGGNNGLVDYGVYSLAVDRKTPDTVYAGTLGGLCKSTDGGAHWEFLPPAGEARPYGGKESAKDALDIRADRNKSVRAVAVDPSNGSVVYAGTPTGKIFPPYGRGAPAGDKSEDGGQSWRKLDYLRAVDSDPKPAAEIPAFSGKGCLVLSFESEAGNWQPPYGRASPAGGKNGRAEKPFDPPSDWSGYRKATARFYLPANAPKLQAQLVVQTGENWLWQGGPFVDGKRGAWTEVAMPLTGMKEMQSVRCFYFVVRSPDSGYHGEVFLDTVTLHTTDDAKGSALLSDWEKAGDVEGWRANVKIKDALFVTEVRQSAIPGTLKEGGAISCVTVSEANPKLVLAATALFGVLRSEDAGETWAALNTPKDASSVAVAASDESILYATFGPQGVWKSMDKGKTWAAVNAGIPPAGEARPYGGKEGYSIKEVAIDPKDANAVYCIGAKGWDGMFYRSTDGGQRWQGIRMMKRDFEADPTNPEDYGGRKTGTCPLSNPKNLSINPLNPKELFIAGNWRLAFSQDGGETWEERVRGADITCVTDIRFFGGKTYVTAMDEGLLVSDDNGGSWRQLCPLKFSDALNGHQWRVHVWPKGDTVKILSTLSPWHEPPNRVLISEDGGKTFKACRDGLPDYRPTANTMWGQSYPRALAADPKDPNVLYLGMDGDPQPAAGKSKRLDAKTRIEMGGGVFKSLDGGYTWKQLPNQPGSRRVFNALAVDPTNPKRLYWGTCATGGGLYRSDDAGETWKHIFPPAGEARPYGGKDETWVFNVLISPTGVVYCPGVNLWRSADHGETWKKLTQFADDLAIVGLEIDPRDEKTLWMSRVTWYSRAIGAVYKTTDGGVTWQDITGDLPYRKPTVLRFNSATQELWAGGVGLFKAKQ